MTREPAYAALFDLLRGAAAWRTESRRLRHWADVPLEQQPAMFMAQKGEVAEKVRGQPTRWTCMVDIYVYASTAGGRAPGPILNELLDAIEAALHPSTATEEDQTLGGLVEWCRIDGAIETDEGTLGDQAVAIVPVIFYVT